MERIDPHKLQQLVDAHGAALTLYARQWCNAPEDALQESLLELLRQNFVPDCPEAWLFKTIRYRAMNLARSERRRAEHHRRASQQRVAWFLDNKENEFDSEELENMLSQLQPTDREIVVARIWGTLSFQQIAELVGISSSSVHRRYNQALSRLGDMINGKLNTSGQNDGRGTQIPNRSDV